jgi:H+/Cl- antiporter ClcA
MPSVSSLLTSAPLESLPLVAAQSLQMASSSAAVYSLPVTASVTIPEPTSAMLGAAGLLLAGIARRRR